MGLVMLSSIWTWVLRDDTNQNTIHGEDSESLNWQQITTTKSTDMEGNFIFGSISRNLISPGTGIFNCFSKVLIALLESNVGIEIFLNI